MKRNTLPILGWLLYGSIAVAWTVFAFVMAWLMVALLVGILFFGLQIPS